jgi:DNA primase
VLVEGNLDVVTAHQFGFKQVVATSGTALSQWQLKSLGRLSQNVKLAFDQDSAGLAATERAIPIAQTAEVSLSIVNLPGAKDPDELIRRSPDSWKEATGKAVYVMDWLLKTLSAQYDANSATGKKQISDRFIATLARLGDPVEQDHYAQALAKLVEVEPAAIRRKLDQSDTQQPRPNRIKTSGYQASVRNENAVVEDALLSIAMTYPDTRIALDDAKAEDLSSPERQQVYQSLRSIKGEIDPDKLPKPLHNSGNYVKILLLRGEEQYRDWAALDRRIEAFSLAQRLASLQLKKAKQTLQDQIAAAEAGGNESKRNELLKQFRDMR